MVSSITRTPGIRGEYGRQRRPAMSKLERMPILAPFGRKAGTSGYRASQGFRRARWVDWRAAQPARSHRVSPPQKAEQACHENPNTSICSPDRRTEHSPQGRGSPASPRRRDPGPEPIDLAFQAWFRLREETAQIACRHRLPWFAAKPLPGSGSGPGSRLGQGCVERQRGKALHPGQEVFLSAVALAATVMFRP